MDRKTILMRQKSMDQSQSRDAMKILEKYCRKKYRNSTLIPSFSLPPDFDPSVTPEPLSPSISQTLSPKFTSVPAPNCAMPPQSPGLYARPQSLFFSSQEAPPSRPIHTPRTVSELLEPPIKDEIKRSPKEPRSTHVWRVIKFFYDRYKLHHVAGVFFIIFYSLLGGAIFFYLEAPEESRRHDLHVAASLIRHRAFSDCYCSNKCDGMLESFRTFTNSSLAHRVQKRTQENCLHVLSSMLKSYDIAAGYEPIGKRIWSFNDYWNAVFYAWSLLTTIGYGNLSCRTYLGRVATIIYASIGIPLMLVSLNSLGKVCFSSVRRVWERIRRKVRSKTRHLQKSIFLQRIKSMDFVTNDDEIFSKTMAYSEDYPVEENDADSTEVDFFQTFPMPLAFSIVVIYIGMCSIIFSFWEEWDYFTAFYFFFISLSTIGLGDEIPQQPHYACLFFVFFVLGLALVSMCVAIMQTRVENRYMAALMLIDEEHRNDMPLKDMETLSSQILPGTDGSPSPNNKFPHNRPLSIVGAGPPAGTPGLSAIKWRRPMMLFQLHATTEEPEDYVDDHEQEHGEEVQTQHTPKSADSDDAPRSPFYRMASTSSLSGRSSTYVSTPPVLSALLSRRTSTKRMREANLLRAESMKHVDVRERLDSSPLLDRSHWQAPHVDTPIVNPQISAVHQQRTSMYNAPLSVITEASDEEVREQLNKKRNSRPQSLDVSKEL